MAAIAPPVSAPDANGFVLPNPDSGTTGGTYPLLYPAPGSTIDRRQLAQLAATIGTILAGAVNDAASAAANAAAPYAAAAQAYAAQAGAVLVIAQENDFMIMGA